MLDRLLYYFVIFLMTVFVLYNDDLYCQSLLINEIQSSNASTIADENGDFEDWIELYNGTDAAINLEGYYLSDDINNLQMWTFPEVIIEPSEFLLIFASGKDRKDSPFLHTNFSIDKNGETLLLSDNNGIITDYFTPVYIPTDHSYGRIPDGSLDFRFFTQPSPGTINSGSVFTEVLTPVQFSTQGGFYTDEFYLHLSHPDPDVTIVYTLDGSEPDIENLDGTRYYYKNEYAFYPEEELGDLHEDSYKSQIYNSRILITDRSLDPDKLAKKSTTVHKMFYEPLSPVAKSTPVRAIAYKEGAHKSAIKTQTFFVSPQGREKYPIPVVAINLNEDALFDYETGIYTAGEAADIWRMDNPDLKFSWMFEGNFHRRGEITEFPANFEFFNVASRYSNLNQCIGLRLHGNASRCFQMKSLRLYARSAYDASSMNYAFFPGNNITSFKRLILRNSGNDFPTSIWEPRFYSRTLFRDAAIHCFVRHLKIDIQDYIPTVVFINGEFWGIHNLRERLDKYYLQNKYIIDSGQIDYLTGISSIKEGTNHDFIKLSDFIENNSMSINDNYEYVQQKIDTDNFIDYQIIQIYADNTDWPGNNIDFWRKNRDINSNNIPYGHDGKWRWILCDTDLGFGLWDNETAYQHNSLEHATTEDGEEWPNPPWSTFLLRSLLENDTFRQDFINRFEYHLLHTFHPNRVIPIIDSIADIIRPLIPMHSHRWNQGSLTLGEWERNVNVMREFAIKRPCVMRQHLKDFFNIKNDNYAIGACEYDIINSSQRYEDLITIYPNPANDVIYVEFPNDIHYFTEIRIIDNTGRQITHFETKIFRNILEINISSLNPGFYLLNISTVEHYFAKSFVILR